MKTLMPLRILTVVVAASMMTGYVVYSRQQTRSAAPGSKADVLRPGTPAAPPLAGTTNAPALDETIMASSSKSIAPALRIKPGPATPAGPLAATNSAPKILTNPPAASQPSS